MNLRERENREAERQPQAGPGAAGGGNLGDLLQAGLGFSAAGDEAIRRALSGNSEAFLAATRQEGGQ
jgi:hypothetical protein